MFWHKLYVYVEILGTDHLSQFSASSNDECPLGREAIALKQDYMAENTLFKLLEKRRNII